MDRVAVFVDAGYLFAAGSQAVFGKKKERSGIPFESAAAVKALKEFAERKVGLPLLRIYWYDGTSSGPTFQHRALADQPETKVRLGNVNNMGHQKGVDSLIVTDMVMLAQNRAMASCVLLSGDEDLRVGVSIAQMHGVRVHLLGIAPAGSNQSRFLFQEADKTHEWTSDQLRQFLGHQTSASVDAPGHGQQDTHGEEAETSILRASESERANLHDEFERIAIDVAVNVPNSDLNGLLQALQHEQPIPREYHAHLLALAKQDNEGERIGPEQKRKLLRAFRQAIEARIQEHSAS